MIFAYQCTICIRKKSSQNWSLFALLWSLLFQCNCSSCMPSRIFFVFFCFPYRGAGMGEKGMPRLPPQFLADQLTLFQPVHCSGGDYVYHITTGPSRFLNFPTSLPYINTCTVGNFRFLMHGHKKVLLH